MSFLTGRVASTTVVRPCLRRPLVQLSRPAAAAAVPSSSCSFHSSGARRVMSENDHHDDEEQRRSKIDAHKEDALKKQKEGKGEWKRELASTSEAAIKADRDEIKATEENIDQLQKETSKMAEKQKKAGRS